VFRHDNLNHLKPHPAYWICLPTIYLLMALIERRAALRFIAEHGTVVAPETEAWHSMPDFRGFGLLNCKETKTEPPFTKT
jgi:hypothetical protein